MEYGHFSEKNTLECKFQNNEETERDLKFYGFEVTANNKRKYEKLKMNFQNLLTKYINHSNSLIEINKKLKSKK